MTDGVKNLRGKRRSLDFALYLISEQARHLNPSRHRDGISELRTHKRNLEDIREDDLEELNQHKRRQQPAGVLR